MVARGPSYRLPPQSGVVLFEEPGATSLGQEATLPLSRLDRRKENFTVEPPPLSRFGLGIHFATVFGVAITSFHPVTSGRRIAKRFALTRGSAVPSSRPHLCVITIARPSHDPGPVNSISPPELFGMKMGSVWSSSCRERQQIESDEAGVFVAVRSSCVLDE